MEGDPVARADYEGVGSAIRQPNTGREQLPADFSPAILGNGSDSADPHLARVHIVTFNAPAGPVRDGEVFPTESQVERQLGANRPTIPGIEAVKPSPNAVHVWDLECPPSRVRQTQHERGKAVEPGTIRHRRARA